MFNCKTGPQPSLMRIYLKNIVIVNSYVAMSENPWYPRYPRIAGLWMVIPLNISKYGNFIGTLTHPHISLPEGKLN